jgi:hypothetical protein
MSCHKRGLPCADLREIYGCSAALCADLLYRTAPKSDTECGRYGQTYTDTRKQSATVTEPIVTKLTVRRQISVKHSHTKFHKNLANSLVTDTRSHTEGRGLHIRVGRSLCTSSRTPSNLQPLQYVQRSYLANVRRPAVQLGLSWLPRELQPSEQPAARYWLQTAISLSPRDNEYLAR